MSTLTPEQRARISRGRGPIKEANEQGGIDLFLERLEERGFDPVEDGKGWIALCPVHGDSNPSLGVWLDEENTAAFCCRSQACEYGDILHALDLTPADLHGDYSANGNGYHREPAPPIQFKSKRGDIEYPYEAADGEVLFKVVRRKTKPGERKQFVQVRPDDEDGWLYGLDDVPRVLYRLPEVLAAVEAGGLIFIAEGEKDVEALVEAGVTATCNSMGAGKWTAEVFDPLRGAIVVVIADRDDAGRKHGEEVVACLHDLDCTTLLVEAASGKDAYDHLAEGFTVDDFVEIEEDTTRPVRTVDQVRSHKPKWLWDKRLMLGYLNVWSGETGQGKSLLAAYIMDQLTRGNLEGQFYDKPMKALAVVSEDGLEDMWKPRFQALGNEGRIEFADYPKTGWNIRDNVDLIADSLTPDVPFVFIDALMEHLPQGKSGQNANDAGYVRECLAPLRQLAQERNVAILFSLHPPKGGGARFIDNVANSAAFTQVARVGLLFGYHPEDEELPKEEQRRVLLRGKGNVGRNPGALSFRIEEKEIVYDSGEKGPEAFVTDLEPCDLTERDLLSGSESEQQTPEEKAWVTTQIIEQLEEKLRDGNGHRGVETELMEDGYSKTSIYRATNDLGVVKKMGLWSLPNDD